MKMKSIYILAIIILYSPSAAQNSIHYKDKYFHKAQIENTEWNNLQIFSNTNSLNKTVFGFLPYWELQQASIRLDLLSHIALFDFVLNEDGSLTPPYNWPEAWQPIISEATMNKVKVLLTVSNLTDTATDSILVSQLINNQGNKNNFFNNVKNLIDEYNLDGVILDFENLKLSEHGDPINNFTQEFKDSLNNWFTDKELSFATPAVNWVGRWKLKELSEICDYLFIMAYDYHGSWSENAGPVAPLSGNDQYNLRNYKTTIESDYAEIDPSKLILGVPYYGAKWTTDNTNPYTEVIPFGEPDANWAGNINYENINWSELENNFLLDSISQTPYLIVQTNNKDTLIWIDNEYSLSLKYDFALEKNLRGIGMWSLGKDGNHPELWKLIEEKFADTTTAVENDQLISDFILYQNYPNPFNPSTTIKFTIPRVKTTRRVVSTKLIVYDILGREVQTLLNKSMQPGTYEVNFNASGLPSGVYFSRLTAGDFVETKKLVLIK